MLHALTKLIKPFSLYLNKVFKRMLKLTLFKLYLHEATEIFFLLKYLESLKLKVPLDIEKEI